MFIIIRFIRTVLILSSFFCLHLEGEEKQTIAILACQAPNMPEWDPDSIHSGIAGSEEAVIYMSQQLAMLGYEVVVFGKPPAGSPHSRKTANPRFLPLDAFEDTKFYNIAISWRAVAMAQELRSCADKVYFWPHDRESSLLVAKEQIEAFDDVLWLSKWQRDVWMKKNPHFAKFTHIFGNGINPEQFKSIVKRKNPYSCIYGSNYGQGLDLLLDIWPEVKERFPKATLDIYYGWNHYGFLSKEKEAKMKKQIVALRALGVQEHGRVSHKELHKAYSEASFWSYPCVGWETFSITALKAQVSGAVPVVLIGSALSETVGSGYRCKTAEEYKGVLLEAMSKAESLSVNEREQGRLFVLENYTWEKIALKWKALFDAKQGEKLL